ncbi:MICOS complex subunit Mic60 isoform X2 [Bombyx mori]|uniref:MICOS complex subunit MIC60 n=1 Tax=Bombyx mori TaxID=7091 RepID=A0A8R2M910_BOMMO|nr:MICOS complex subunit Mic60 isoform X2 [Bombyx mori]
MYKFTNHLSNAKLVLVRRHIDGSSAALIVLRQNSYSQDHGTRQQPRKSRKLFWSTVGATVLTGAAVVYAKHSPEARNWLESNVPWANDLVALVYQEKSSPWKFTVDRFNQATTSISHFVFGKEGVTPLEIKSRSQQDIDADAAKKATSKDFQSTVVQTERCEPARAPAAAVPAELVQLERDMMDNTKLALDSYKRASQHCKRYNDALYKIVESTVEELDKRHFSALQGAQSERDAAHEQAAEAAARAKSAIQRVESALEAGAPVPPPAAAATRRHAAAFGEQLAAAEAEYCRCRDEALLADRYWDKVEAARSAFRAELAALFPGADLSARSLPSAHVDLLLVYTLKQIQFLQNQLAELQTVREQKINRAIECHDEKALIEAKVEDLIKAERVEREKEFLKRSLALQAEAHRSLREQLKKQFEIQQEVLQEKVASKEKEVMSRLARAQSERLEHERAQHKRELGAAAARLAAVQHALKQRAGAEEEARRSAALWAAAGGVLAALSAPRRAPLRDHVAAVRSAGKDDKLVQSILQSISRDALEHGVATEQELRDSFDRMEKTVLKVALVGREGASLPVYFLSWLQSKLLFYKLSELPEEEMEDKPVDYTKLDNFEIMQRARWQLERGAVERAARLVGALRGAGRAAGAAWAGPAREHLAVRQAAHALMAHAELSSLLHV